MVLASFFGSGFTLHKFGNSLPVPTLVSGASWVFISIGSAVAPGDRVSVRGLISGPFSLPASWVPNSRLALPLVYQASGFQLRSSFC